MKIVIYNTNSFPFDGTTFHYKNFPSNKENWIKVLQQNPEFELIFVTQLPSLFLLDLQNNEADLIPNIKTIIVNDKTKEITQKIIEQNPDYVIAASFWVNGFDWLPLKDSIIGEILQNSGIKVIYQNKDFVYKCSDKNQTYNLLKENGFPVANAIYVNHELFCVERSHSQIGENIYKEFILSEIKKITFPVVIKDTLGLSSFGMEVCNNFGEAKNFLLSKRNNSDRIVEEFIQGFQFGCEIYVSESDVYISDPFMFSVNQYGITSPKQSVKVGPVTSEKFKIKELKLMLTDLVRKLDLKGFAQVDLVFNEDLQQWFIIEINPRLSGMTNTLCASYGITTQDLIINMIKPKALDYKSNPTVSIKFQNLNNENLEKIKSYDFVKHVQQIENDLAKQEREKGFCEVIISDISFDKLKEDLILIEKDFNEVCEKDFFEKAYDLIKLF